MKKRHIGRFKKLMASNMSTLILMGRIQKTHRSVNESRGKSLIFPHRECQVMKTHSVLLVSVLYFLAVILSYIITLPFVQAFWRSPLNVCYAPEIGVDPRSAFLYAAAVLVVPYVTGGLVLGYFRLDNTLRVSILGVAAAVGERLLILAGTMVVLGTFPGSIASTLRWFLAPGADLVTMIRIEALPYFTWAYVILGIPISLLVLLGVVRAVSTRRRIAWPTTP